MYIYIYIYMHTYTHVHNSTTITMHTVILTRAAGSGRSGGRAPPLLRAASARPLVGLSWASSIPMFGHQFQLLHGLFM